MELTAKQISSNGGKKRWKNLKAKMSKKELSDLMKKVSKARVSKKVIILPDGFGG